MKKKFITIFSIILFACAWLTGCKKESTSAENAGEMSDLQVGNNSSCKLTHNVWAYWYTWDFHYNDKGLADEWRLDLGGGFIRDFKMKYDKFGKLVDAPGYDDFNNLIFTNTFTYSGNQVTSQKWADLLGGVGGEILFSYNSKGQIVRQDDGDTHIFLTYDNKGNWIRSDFFIGSDIYFSDIYEYGSQVRNPVLTVSGVDWPFPFYGGSYFENLWFSRNLSIVYDGDGNQYVVNDLVASKEDFIIGPQNFPSAVHYYDRVSESRLDFLFAYNCNGNDNIANQDLPQENRNIGTNKTIKSPKPMLIGAGKSIREQLQDLRKEYSTR